LKLTGENKYQGMEGKIKRIEKENNNNMYMINKKVK
jgi:hypothetical protein